MRLGAASWAFSAQTKKVFLGDVECSLLTFCMKRWEVCSHLCSNKNSATWVDGLGSKLGSFRRVVLSAVGQVSAYGGMVRRVCSRAYYTLMMNMNQMLWMATLTDPEMKCRTRVVVRKGTSNRHFGVEYCKSSYLVVEMMVVISNHRLPKGLEYSNWCRKLQHHKYNTFRYYDRSRIRNINIYPTRPDNADNWEELNTLSICLLNPVRMGGILWGWENKA